MPKVKNARGRKTKAKSKRKAARQPGILENIGDFFSRYTAAAAAGLTVVALIAAMVLWSGGYFGLLGERVTRIADSAAVTAGFEIQRITAKGYDQTSESDILNALGPVVGSSIAHFDPFTAQARIEELGWVRSAAVSRLWPDTVHISVREREPAAVWQLSGALHLIDQSGAVIRQIDAYEYSNLPLIVGAGAPGSASGVLKALRREPALWGAASALIRVGDRRWNLRLQSGADIKFPETGYEAAVKELAALQAAYGLLDQDLEYIDLRDPNNMVYRKAGVGEKDVTAPPITQ
ncbi:MAG: cell division protein FtsQ [Hyphococcus sp.]|nr:MAG: cell division protein FtsQ [Marinicaulis sp.]